MQQLLKGGLTEPGGTSRSLNQYIFKDTDWGGKTGTSNNHSDAWFMAVSPKKPKLVVGAWVGWRISQHSLPNWRIRTRV